MGYLNEDGLATLVGKVKGQVVQLTAAEYRQIPAETKNTDNTLYFVEDDDYAYAIDSEPTLNSENLVKSGGVYNYTSKIGTGALTTTAQTIIPAVNELKAAVDTNTSDIATLNNGLTYVDSDQLTITANANSNNIGTVNFGNRLNGYTVLGYSVQTDSVSGSWYVQVSYISRINQVSFFNYGSASNTWKGVVRAAVKKNR